MADASHFLCPPDACFVEVGALLQLRGLPPKDREPFLRELGVEVRVIAGKRFIDERQFDRAIAARQPLETPASTGDSKGAVE